MAMQAAEAAEEFKTASDLDPWNTTAILNLGNAYYFLEDWELASQAFQQALELDFSLVAMTYSVGDRPLGGLGIFGPSRMDYEKVIPLVDYLGDRLSEALEDRKSTR